MDIGVLTKGGESPTTRARLSASGSLPDLEWILAIWPYKRVYESVGSLGPGSCNRVGETADLLTARGSLPGCALRASLLMRKKNVLVVDDEPDQREIYRAVLSHAGYSVLQAGDALEGIRLARETLPDLILLDIALPGLDGWAAAGMLKAEPATAAIPICAISAHLPTDENDLSARAGFACYLLKPVEPRAVLNEIRSRIGPAVAPGSKVVG